MTLTAKEVAALPDILKIESAWGVRVFFDLLLDAGINFHPDTPFGQYIDGATGEPMFALGDAWRLDDLMLQAHQWGARTDEDIYAIALQAVRDWQVACG